MSEFKGTDVQTLLLGQADQLLISIPESVETGTAIVALIAKKATELGLNSIETDLVSVFQLATIDARGNFARGFPGIVLTATIGRLIDNEYRPFTRFYDISPRALFEKHIYPTMSGIYNAPMGKSDPLNVAKNANHINRDWASGKRPEYAARAASQLVEWVNDASKRQLEALLELLIYVYLLLAKLSKREFAEIEAGQGPQVIYTMLRELIDEAPAGGNTAQAVVGAALEAQHQTFGVSGILSGVGESVFATNTTSKKAGDFIEEFESQTRIYEVTTKTVDSQRVVESAEAVYAYLENVETPPLLLEVTFLCELEDVTLEGIENGTYVQNGIKYHFVDIWQWLFNLLERLGAQGRKLTLDMVSEHIGNNSTQLRVKTTWGRLIEGK